MAHADAGSSAGALEGAEQHHACPIVANDQHIVSSWTDNAAAWTDAVRNRLIPSRDAGTDQAIVAACVRAPMGATLDAGCGEGWLVRELGKRGYPATGIDVSAALIDRARELGGGEFAVVPYAELIHSLAPVAGPWTVIVCNFSLLSDPLSPLLDALRCRLAPGGRLLVQTVHPWSARGERPYRSEWRTETFDAFAVPFPSPMPWYYRTMASWLEEFSTAQLRVVHVDEPLHPATGTPLSALFHCESA